MKKLSILDKLLFFVNSLLATLLLVSYLGYFISPNIFAFFSFLSLTIPFSIILNLIFIVYWVLKLKKQFLLSTIVLLIGYQYITKFYSLSEKKVLLTEDAKLMSYNVRMFNLYNWIDEENIDQKIFDFIKEKSPDILCIQEFHPSKKLNLNYPYKYVKIRTNQNNFGHAIFSKYKIINSGSLNFSNSSNNAIFVDLIKNNDTIRVYNIHLESLKINPKEETLTQKNSEKLKLRVENAFKKQANQAKLIIQHQEKINHKSIICGDFNNNAFSWVYNQLKKGKNDAFEIAGKGFGTTFYYKFPFRIDFIFTDEKIEVNNYKTYDVKYSDHFPIMARLNFETN
ncbi:endonuclease/exonuclease/phosphatase family metal-dependent hydrolase [Lutibacter oceani]|uniref:Endonuclease/exonuclease/phosphatase family metal-dependent hydrolase n=1 Tax=Lutibacter oceani TaxID=1853311 RepID=A0A3D9RQI5_9FLAO|nr:endonuclease/exonuclease/phosphatase family protein [Lutibacter oceani]REE79951.1 endonuclease/exonuclease/phosphatase family metal-dependent hydrolase [Lutibacter oceani]